MTVASLSAHERFLELEDAIAEIERLTAENEAIRKDRDDLLQQALGVEAERDIARMENERLRAALQKIADDGKNCTDYCRRQAGRALVQQNALKED